jgi:hypothetical protein
MAVRPPFSFDAESSWFLNRGGVDSPPADRDPMEDPEELFVGLDGRQVTVAGRSWRLQVYGACDGGGPRWVQLGLTGAAPVTDATGTHMLTLRLGPGEDVSHAVKALASWLANPSNKRNILSYA